MDPQRHDELLTAYLDRELPPDERAAMDRLLDSSTEARRRLHELETSSRFLRKLPRQELGASFADSVLERLQRESLLRPEPVVPHRRSHRWATWVGGSMAAAASLLLAVWGMQDFRRGDRRNPVSDVAARTNAATPEPIALAGSARLSETYQPDLMAGASDSFNLPDIVGNPALAYSIAVPDQLRAGDAFTIMDRDRSRQVVLMLVDRSTDGRNLIHGILMAENALDPTEARAQDAQPADANRPLVTTVVADTSDFEKMLDAVKQSVAQNSVPLVDVSFGGLEEFMGEGAFGKSTPNLLVPKEGQGRNDETPGATRGRAPDRRAHQRAEPSAGNQMPPAVVPPSSSNVALQGTLQVTEEKRKQESPAKDLSQASEAAPVNRPAFAGDAQQNKREGTKGSKGLQDVQKLGREPGRAKVLDHDRFVTRVSDKEREPQGRLHVLLQIALDPDQNR